MPTVLIVEDDQATRNLLVTALSHLGIDVAAAVDGADGLEILDSGTGACRLVILDLLMPRLDGRQFLNELSRRRGPRPIVILITAAVGFEELPRDVDLVVKKPFDIAAVTATVVRVLQLGGAVAPPLETLRPEPPASGE